MRVVYHSAVQKDVNRILNRYDAISCRLGNDIWLELNRSIQIIAANPLRFPPLFTELRRANFNRFPYHILYRVLPDRIRITAVRHHNSIPERPPIAARVNQIIDDGLASYKLHPFFEMRHFVAAR